LASLEASGSHEVTVMANLAARDVRSTTGSNIKLLEDSSGLNPGEYGTFRMKQELEKKDVVDIPEQDNWRINYLASLLEQRQVQHYEGNVEEETD
jgi:hypothetical protein